MVRIGAVWDRTVDVLRGRASMLGGVAFLAVFLPSVLQSAATLLAPGSRGLIALLSLVTLIATIWGQLAMLAIATDPATDRQEAGRQATARLLPALGVVLLLVFALVLLMMPLAIALVQSGVDFSSGRVDTTTIPAGVRGFLTLYLLAFIVLAFWVAARLVLVNPVILNERLGLGAITRSVRLTRGLTWRIIGVILLFFVVVLVTAGAVQSVVAILLRLVLGAEALPLVSFIAGLVATAVTTVFTVVAAAFTAQLYVAARAGSSEA